MLEVLALGASVTKRRPAAGFLRTALGAPLLFALPAGTDGCNLKPEPPAPFEILINVTSDRHPLPGAVIMKGGKEGPSTGTDGRVSVKIGGQEGESVDLTVKCPADYVSPTKPISVLLRRNGGGKLPEFDASCPPTIRHLVVAVRADNGANLPVRILNQEVGRTDGAGAFTYVKALRPNEGIEMTIDTSSNPRLSPKSPSKSFTMAGFDDVMTFDQKFDQAPPPRPPVVRGPQRPIQIGPRRGVY